MRSKIQSVLRLYFLSALFAMPIKSEGTFVDDSIIILHSLSFSLFNFVLLAYTGLTTV